VANESNNLELVYERGIELVKFYRENPCIAVYELLGVDLAPIQRLVFEDMWFKNYVITVASRGFGKTYLLAVLATLSCMLYPGYRVGLIAPVFRQSKMIFGEIEKLYLYLNRGGSKQQVEESLITLKESLSDAKSFIEQEPIGPGER
jgi:hypothetical protein